MRVQSTTPVVRGVALAFALVVFAGASRAEPWFTGPLEAPAATVSAPGQLTLEPSLSLSNGRASYGQNGQRIATSHPSYTINPQLLFQLGIAPRVQLTLLAQGAWNRESGESSSGFGDTGLGLGFALLDEDPETLAPAVRLDLQATLPTGDYQRLDSELDGSDATGNGSYIASLRLNAAKTFRVGEHVFRPHACVVYDFYSSHANVHGANAYGGGRGTSGTVTPGRSLTAYLSGEYALSQRWALALDLVYTHSGRNDFDGEAGVQPNGAPASVGNDTAQLYTIAPALEYSWSETRGVVAGATFDVAGRNASQAISLQVQYSASFDLF
jgi:hypothetical protein